MKKITLFTLLTLLLCTSCVTKKKFMLAEMAATASKDSLQGLLNNSREVGNQLSAQVKNLLRDTTKMGNSIRQYQSMLNVNMTEQEKLNALLSQKKNELNERERTINELQDMIKAQNDKVQNLLSNVKDALLGFSTDELTVREKDGKVYVAMSDKLLFQSGSARLDKRGEEALGKLAEVLNKQTDIDVFIEGHTDNKPINTVQFKDNWDLSVIRATSVVRILIKNYNVNPLQIQPSGRGEYMPIDDNETIEGSSIVEYFGLEPYVNTKFGAYQSVFGNTTNASDWPLMRVEEMYLIKAEAEAMSGNLAAGKSTLENFVQAYRDPSFVSKATSPQQFQDEVWLQRRMELWGEGHSLFDLLRLKKPVIRKNTNYHASVQFNLEPESQIMIYRIPQCEMETNTGISDADNNPAAPQPAL